MSADFPMANKLMQHFATLWGAQKVKAMYLEDDNAIMAANESWETFLRAADKRVLRRVINSLSTAGRDWPPGLAEFRKMYQDFDRVEHREINALPAPRQVTEKGKFALAAIKNMLEAKRERV